MKLLITILFILNTAIAAEWKITKHKRFFFLEKGKEKYALDVDLGTPKFLEEKKLNDNFTVLIYKSGELGTQTVTVVERCLLFKKGKFVGNVPYRYYRKGTEEKLGPEWKVSKDKIVINDQDENKSWSF